MLNRAFKIVNGMIKYICLIFTLFSRKLFYKKSVYFITTPISDNLGDYAIVYAQYKLFRDIGLERYIVDLTSREYERLSPIIKFFIKDNDLIIIDGGGNIGTLWEREEKRIRGLINNFKKNPVFIFPQTAFFEESEKGRKELNNSINIYNSHPDLTVFCRDINTYNLFKDKFDKLKAFYTPDMVMYLDNISFDGNSNNIIFNIRTDLESIFDRNIFETNKNVLISKGYSVVYSSTKMQRS